MKASDPLRASCDVSPAIDTGNRGRMDRRVIQGCDPSLSFISLSSLSTLSNPTVSTSCLVFFPPRSDPRRQGLSLSFSHLLSPSTLPLLLPSTSLPWDNLVGGGVGHRNNAPHPPTHAPPFRTRGKKETHPSACLGDEKVRHPGAPCVQTRQAWREGTDAPSADPHWLPNEPHDDRFVMPRERVHVKRGAWPNRRHFPSKKTASTSSPGRRAAGGTKPHCNNQSIPTKLPCDACSTKCARSRRWSSQVKQGRSKDNWPKQP